MLRTDKYIVCFKDLMHESNLDIHNGDHQSDATDGQDLVESQSVVKKAYSVSLKQPCVLQKNCNPAASERFKTR